MITIDLSDEKEKEIGESIDQGCTKSVVVIDLNDDCNEPSSSTSKSKANLILKNLQSPLISLIDEEKASFAISKYDLPRSVSYYPILCSIHASLEDFIRKLHYKIDYSWLYNDTRVYNVVELNIKSVSYPERVYRFQLRFPFDFPEAPFAILPLDRLPGLEFCVIGNHPILTSKLWSSTTTVYDALAPIISHLETIVYECSKTSLALESGIYDDESIRENSLECLISILHGCYLNELKGYKRFKALSTKLIPSDLCVCLGSLTSHNENKTKGFAKGTGYSSSAYGGGATIVFKESKIKSVILKIFNKLSVMSRYSCLENIALCEWLIESTLANLIYFLFFECSHEEIYRQRLYIGQLAVIALRLDWATFAVSSSDSNVSTRLIERCPEVKATLREIFEKLYSCELKNLFDAQCKDWLKELKAHKNNIYQEIMKNSATGDEGKSSSDLENGKDSKDTKRRVIHIPGLELQHYFYRKGNTNSEKLSKHWLRELSFIEENLPEEVTLFVSEEKPNYFVALLYLINSDSPYYGGTFIFHCLIASTYPAQPPKVQFMTTGEGSVRFNPNNCGKVCLSLLEEPYYNEPANEQTRGTPLENEQCRLYNVEVIKNTLKFAILYHLQSRESKYGEIVSQYICEFYKANWELSIIDNLLSMYGRCLDRYPTAKSAVLSILKEINAKLGLNINLEGKKRSSDPSEIITISSKISKK